MRQAAGGGSPSKPSRASLRDPAVERPHIREPASARHRWPPRSAVVEERHSWTEYAGQSRRVTGRVLGRRIREDRRVAPVLTPPIGERVFELLRAPQMTTSRQTKGASICRDSRMLSTWKVGRTS